MNKACHLSHNNSIGEHLSICDIQEVEFIMPNVFIYGKLLRILNFDISPYTDFQTLYKNQYFSSRQIATFELIHAYIWCTHLDELCVHVYSSSHIDCEQHIPHDKLMPLLWCIRKFQDYVYIKWEYWSTM